MVVTFKQFKKETTVETPSETVLEIPAREVSELFVAIAIVSSQLNSFVIKARPHKAQPYITFASVTADYTTPAGRLSQVGIDYGPGNPDLSGDLTLLKNGDVGHFIVDVASFESIKITASSDASSTLIIKAGGL